MKEGVLPVDKPAGPTSHDVVVAVRRALGTRRVGHTGTLDPFASGLLLVCVGRSTRISEYLSRLDKSYEALARLGVATDSEDTDGVVVAEADPEAVGALTRQEVEAAFGRLRGPVEQVPPQFSAKKVQGEAMHRRARRGERVALAPRTVTIHELELTRWEPPLVGFRVRCSTGTYVRSLARDVGDALGVGAHLTQLRRTAIGSFRIERALHVDDLADEDRLADAWIDPLVALGHLGVVEVEAEQASRLADGQPVRHDPEGPSGTVAVALDGALVAVAESSGGLLEPRKVFRRG